MNAGKAPIYLLVGFHVALLCLHSPGPQYVTRAADAARRQSVDKEASSFDLTLTPLTLIQLQRLIQDAPDEAVRGELLRRGVNFKVTIELVDELKLMGVRRKALDILMAWISNRPPSVAINIPRTEIEQGEGLTLFADANDPDGDELEYFWFTTHGVIEGAGRVVKLDTLDISLASDALELTASVKVTDRKGDSDPVSRTVIVRRREPIKAMLEGHYLMVTLAGAHNQGPSQKGSMEIEIHMNDNVIERTYVTGMLPGRPCSVSVLARDDNVSDYRVKEPPGVGNGWRRMIVQVLPKDPKRVVRFAINWRVVERSSKRLREKDSSSELGQRRAR